MALVEFEGEASVAIIRLNRPPVNALSAGLVEALIGALVEAARPEFRSVVLTGRPHFAAGADIREFKSVIDGREEDRLGGMLGEAILALEGLAKPTIAAVQGYALGGGLELAMGADFRILAEGATVGQPEIKLGLIPGAGGTQRLPRLVGYSRAADLVFTGRNVEASEALAIGLADRVVPADDLLEAALREAARLAEGPTAALAAAKRAMRAGFSGGLDEGLAAEQAEFRALFRTADTAEGVSAFLEKRPARFQGS